MRFFRFSLLLIVAALTALGCAATAKRREADSPLVGTWLDTPTTSQPSNLMAGMAAGLSRMFGKGDCTLTLKADGTGFLKIPITPERAIAWSEEDGKVILWPRDGDKIVSNAASAPGIGAMVGTLSADKGQLYLDLGIRPLAKVCLTLVYAIFGSKRLR